ncbi:MAG: sulfotransferase, partial [Chloroflexota bacterium]
MPLSSEIEDRPVFLGGIPRSGGAVLCRLLGRHPDLLVHPCQTDFFSTFVPSAAKMTNDERIPLAERTLLLCRSDGSDTLAREAIALDFVAVRARFVERLLGSTMLLSDYLSSAILSIGEVSGTLNERRRLWVERTSFNELHAHQIFAWWQHARLIQIVRD